MKATDLMIGDWVYNKHHNENIQIKPYDFFVHGHGNNGVFVVSSTIVSGRDFEPIPLTEEILAKNGFKYSMPHNDWTNADCNFYLYEGGSGYRIQGTDIKLDYVHQLQHLLRLVGVQKEIEL